MGDVFLFWWMKPHPVSQRAVANWSTWGIAPITASKLQVFRLLTLKAKLTTWAVRKWCIKLVAVWSFLILLRFGSSCLCSSFFPQSACKSAVLQIFLDLNCKDEVQVVDDSPAIFEGTQLERQKHTKTIKDPKNLKPKKNTKTNKQIVGLKKTNQKDPRWKKSPLRWSEVVSAWAKGLETNRCVPWSDRRRWADGGRLGSPKNSLVYHDIICFFTVFTFFFFSYQFCISLFLLFNSLFLYLTLKQILRFLATLFHRLTATDRFLYGFAWRRFLRECEEVHKHSGKRILRHGRRSTWQRCTIKSSSVQKSVDLAGYTSTWLWDDIYWALILPSWNSDMFGRKRPHDLWVSWGAIPHQSVIDPKNLTVASDKKCGWTFWIGWKDAERVFLKVGEPRKLIDSGRCWQIYRPSSWMSPPKWSQKWPQDALRHLADAQNLCRELQLWTWHLVEIPCP